MKSFHHKSVYVAVIAIASLLLLVTACKHDPEFPGEPVPPDPDPTVCDTANVTFNGSVQPIFQANCLTCHSGANPAYGLDFTNFDHLASIVNSGSLIGAINHNQGYYPMPKNGNKLAACDIRKIELWARDTSFPSVYCDTTNVTYKGTVLPILQAKCFDCHSGAAPTGNLDFTNYDHVALVAENGALMGALQHETGYVPMPKDGNMLDDCSLLQIGIWVRDTTFTNPGGGNEDPCDPDTVYFQNEILPLIISTCATTGCHDQLTGEQEVLLVDYASIIQYGEIEPFDPGNSELYEKITNNDPEDRMPPPPANSLSFEQKNKIKKWIEQGALNNACEEDCDTTNVTFSGTIWPIVELNCLGCHSGPQPSGGFTLVDYNAVVVQANNGKLFGAVNHDPGYVPMPRNAPQLSDCKIDQIRIWIENGTPDN